MKENCFAELIPHGDAGAGYARIFPYISELNQRVGQIQIQFFGKANGGSAGKARNKTNVLYPIFSVFCQRQEYKASFLIPRFCAAGAMAKDDNY